MLGSSSWPCEVHPLAFLGVTHTCILSDLFSLACLWTSCSQPFTLILRGLALWLSIGRYIHFHVYLGLVVLHPVQIAPLLICFAAVDIWVVLRFFFFLLQTMLLKPILHLSPDAQIQGFFLGAVWWVGLVGQMCTWSVLLGNTKSFSKAVVPTDTPPAGNVGSHWSVALIMLCVIRPLNFASLRRQFFLIVVLICVPSWMSEEEYLPSPLLLAVSFLPSYVKHLIQSFAPFLMGLFVSSLLICRSFFMCCGHSSFVRYVCGKCLHFPKTLQIYL